MNHVVSNKHLFELGAALLATGTVAFVLAILVILLALAAGLLYGWRWVYRALRRRRDQRISLAVARALTAVPREPSLAERNDADIAAGRFTQLDVTPSLADQLGVPTQLLPIHPRPSGYLTPGEDFHR